VSRRDQIRMAEDEALAFLHEQRTVICATLGHDGWPHLMPLWYVMRESEDGPQLWAWTYAASQKVRNLQRDPRVTLVVEAGEEYQLLRGIMVKGEAIIHRREADVAAVGMDLFARYAGGDEAVGPEVREMVARQAPKRVALQFVERDQASWDHRKLVGVY
jgi:PPOX class probable F420-dependent enzyme